MEHKKYKIKESINVNGIEIDMLTYKLVDYYNLYVGDYNNLEQIKKAIEEEVDKRIKKQLKKIKEKG